MRASFNAGLIQLVNMDDLTGEVPPNLHLSYELLIVLGLNFQMRVVLFMEQV